MLHVNAHAQYWHWAKDTEGLKSQAMASDGVSKIYVTGGYYGSLSIGGHNISTTEAKGMYIARYDTLGNVLWAKDISYRNRLSFPNDIGVDEAGNAYITGVFMYAGGAGIANFTIKFDSTGNKVWEKGQAVGLTYQGATTSLDYYYKMYHIAVDKQGYSYVTGRVHDHFTYNGTQYGQQSANLQAAVVMQFDPYGNVGWLTIYGLDRDIANTEDIVTDNDGNVLICGIVYSGNARKFIFDGYTLPILSDDSTVFARSGIMYIVKLSNTEGKVMWAKASLSLTAVQGKGVRNNTGYGIAVDSRNDIYVNGCFDESITIDSTTLRESNIKQNEGAAYLAKFSESGEVKWIKTMYDLKYAVYGWQYKIAINNRDDIFTCNQLTSFATTNFHEYTVSRLDTSGAILWNKSVITGAGAMQDVDDICVDAAHNVYVSGHLENGPGDPDVTLLPFTIKKPVSYFDKAYVAKLAPQKPTSVHNLTYAGNVSVYPNPAKGHVIVSFDHKEGADYLISVTDMQGRVLVSKTDIKSGVVNIDINKLPSAVYNVGIYENNLLVKSGKLIVE